MFSSVEKYNMSYLDSGFQCVVLSSPFLQPSLLLASPEIFRKKFDEIFRYSIYFRKKKR